MVNLTLLSFIFHFPYYICHLPLRQLNSTNGK